MTECQSGKSSSAALLVCLFLSGAVSLVYEILWIRDLGLVFGTTVVAITTVLAVFFGGLALGNFLFGRIAERVQNPLSLYAVLELCIGVFAIIFPYAGDCAGFVYKFLYPGVGDTIVGQTAIKIALFAAVLIIPTTLMGGSIPLLSRFFIRTHGSIDRWSGLLYSINTFGAVAGVSICGFFSIRFFGVQATNYGAAIMNVLIALAAYRYSRKNSLQKNISSPPPETVSSHSFSAASRLMLIALFFSGFTALGYEIVWTRYLSLPLSNTRYTYTMILAVFLLGNAIGSMAFSRFSHRIKNGIAFFGVCQLIVALSALLFIPLVFAAATKIPYRLFTFEFLLCAILMLIPTICMGAAFPVAPGILSGKTRSISASTGMCYAVNTFGCIAGSLVTGFLILPVLGISVSLKTILVINIVTGFTCLIADKSGSRIRNLTIAGVFAVPAFCGEALFKVKIPEDFLAGLKSPQETIVRVCEGLENTVWQTENASTLQRSLWTNRTVLGRTLAVQPYEVCPQAIAGHIPMLLHAGNPERVCGICLGTGQTFGSILSYTIKKLDIVEISKSIVSAAGTDFASFNKDLLRDPRVYVHVEDGRNYLGFSAGTYDLITLEPPPPEEAGIVNLYSAEFYRLCRQKLNEKGILSQWLPLYNMAPGVTKRIIATFISEFPRAVLWFNSADIMLLGFHNELSDNPAKILRRLAEDHVGRDLAFSYTGSNLPGMDPKSGEYLSVPDNFFACFLMGPDELRIFSEKAKLITDDHPDLEFLYASTEIADRAEWMVIRNIDSLKTHLADMRGYASFVSPGNAQKCAEMRRRYLDQLCAASYLKMATRRTIASPEETIELCKKALDRNPDNGLASYQLGDCYARQGKLPEAADAYEKAACRLPIVIDIRQKLAVIYKETGRIDEAEKTLGQIDEISKRFQAPPEQR